MSTKDWSQVIKTSDPDILYHGIKSDIGPVAAPLSTTSVELSQGVWIRAEDANNDAVYIGNASVTSAEGYILLPGEEKFVIINDLSKVYVMSPSSPIGARFLAT